MTSNPGVTSDTDTILTACICSILPDTAFPTTLLSTTQQLLGNLLLRGWGFEASTRNEGN